jgi:hypothetical protein
VSGVGNAYIEFMPSSKTYALFEKAMRTQKQVVCTYEGHRRELCAIILGHTKGEEKALTFQFGGTSSQGLPRKGAWRCLWLAKVSDAELRDGAWFSGNRHTQPSHCVDEVDLDVNPSSPYSPKRTLKR